jgi:hypothetical protein
MTQISFEDDAKKERNKQENRNCMYSIEAELVSTVQRTRTKFLLFVSLFHIKRRRETRRDRAETIV